LQLDLIAAVLVGTDGRPDFLEHTHLLPIGHDPPWAKPTRVRLHDDTLDFDAFINALEDEFARSAVGALETQGQTRALAVHVTTTSKAEAEERAVIARAVEAIAATSGAPPVGWHTRSATSPNTRRLLMEHGGFLYDSNAYNDDMPFMASHQGRDLVVLPYAFDTNDMQFQNTHRFVRAADFSGYVLDAFDWLWREGAHAPKMMSVGLHLRMLGRPGRMQALRDMLNEMTRRPGVWIARRDAIARHWLGRAA
jgi:hypothetical protein